MGNNSHRQPGETFQGSGRPDSIPTTQNKDLPSMIAHWRDYVESSRIPKEHLGVFWGLNRFLTDTLGKDIPQVYGYNGLINLTELKKLVLRAEEVIKDAEKGQRVVRLKVGEEGNVIDSEEYTESIRMKKLKKLVQMLDTALSFR